MRSRLGFSSLNSSICGISFGISKIPVDSMSKYTKYKHQYVLDNYDGSKYSRMRTALDCNITENYIYKIMKTYKDKSAM